MNKELLPCPHCGGNNIVIETTERKDRQDCKWTSKVFCLQCFAEVPNHGFDFSKDEAEQNAIAAWNRRKGKDVCVPSDDLISRKHMIQVVDSFVNLSEYYHPDEKCRDIPVATVKAQIKDAPAERVKPIERTSKVKQLSANLPAVGRCECGYYVYIPWQYCPNCGAELDWSEYDTVQR